MLRILTIVVIAIIFGTTSSKNTLLDIQKILNEIPQDRLDSRDLDYVYKLLSTPNRHRYGHRSHKSSPNLMNVQTMNLYMKPKKHFDHYLRMEDRMCEGPGRCGCTGTRCGNTRNGPDDEEHNTVDEIVDEVNRQIERDTTSSSDTTDFDDTGIDLRASERYDDYDDREVNEVNDVDVVVLDAKDKLDSSEIQDLLRNHLTLDRDESIDDIKALKSYLLDLNNEPTTDTSAPTPDEFVSHYQIVKNDVIKQLLNYIKNNTPIPLKHLRNQQKQLLKDLKINYNLGLVNTDDLIPEIVEIVFGEKSGTRIHPHIENNDNIYIPRWHYNSLLQYKKDLRSKLLPLTTQQRERMLNKKTKTIPKFGWRRRFDNGQYGVPFNLEVHGLGQVNP